jgi:integrase
VLGQVHERDPERALIALLYRSGLRVREIVALRPANVDLRRHSVRVLHGEGDKATTRGFRPSCDDTSGPLDRYPQGARHPRRHAVLHASRAAACPVSKSGTPCIDSAARPGWKARASARLAAHVRRRAGARRGCRSARSIAVTSRYLDHLSNAAAIEALEAVELPALDV